MKSISLKIVQKYAIIFLLIVINVEMTKAILFGNRFKVTRKPKNSNKDKNILGDNHHHRHQEKLYPLKHNKKDYVQRELLQKQQRKDYQYQKQQQEQCQQLQQQQQQEEQRQQQQEEDQQQQQYQHNPYDLRFSYEDQKLTMQQPQSRENLHNSIMKSDNKLQPSPSYLDPHLEQILDQLKYAENDEKRLKNAYNLIQNQKFQPQIPSDKLLTSTSPWDKYISHKNRIMPQSQQQHRPLYYRTSDPSQPMEPIQLLPSDWQQDRQQDGSKLTQKLDFSQFTEPYDRLKQIYLDGLISDTQESCESPTDSRHPNKFSEVHPVYMPAGKTTDGTNDFST